MKAQGDFSRAAAACLRTVAEVRNDFSGGASELAGRTARAILTAVEALPESPAEEEEAVLYALAESVCRAKPFMAPFLHLAGALCSGAARTGGGRGAPSARRIREECGRLVERIETAMGRLAEASREMWDLLPESARILTWSRSSTVLEVLRAGAAAGSGPGRVTVPEGRPGYEGRSLAGELAGAGIETVLVTDGAMSAYVDEADAVLLGADSISPRFAVNKVGSGGLALLARRAGVPLFFAAETTKFLPERLQLLDWAGHDPSQVYDATVPGLRVENRYFERIALEPTDRLVTDEGLMSPAEARGLISKMRFCGELYRWLGIEAD